MEIKVGIQQIGRELSVDTEATAAEVEAELARALEAEGLVTLNDSRGRKVLIPAAKIAYLEIGEENARRVGFGAV